MPLGTDAVPAAFFYDQMMRIRAKMQIAACDRARRPNMPRHILSYIEKACAWKENVQSTGFSMI